MYVHVQVCRFIPLASPPIPPSLPLSSFPSNRHIFGIATPREVMSMNLITSGDLSEVIHMQLRSHTCSLLVMWLLIRVTSYEYHHTHQTHTSVLSSYCIKSMTLLDMFG